MDIQAYIQSGIIESYVLGLASADEVAEVEQLAAQNPEILEAINDYSENLEKQAFQNAVSPPPFIKERVMEAITKEEQKVTPVVPMPGTAADIPNRVLENETKVKDAFAYEIPSQSKALKAWQWIAAASIILFISSAAYNVYLYGEYNEKKDQYISLINDRNSLQASNNIYETTIRQMQSANEMITDPAMAKVKMEGVKNNEDQAMVLWDTRTKDVYLVANKLPAPSQGKQYQLWAIVDGKPVDAGMLDEDCYIVCKMKNIPKAQAFAITLEKLGGSADPTMDAMYVMGKI